MGERGKKGKKGTERGLIIATEMERGGADGNPKVECPTQVSVKLYTCTYLGTAR